jgi:hypothetical protein
MLTAILAGRTAETRADAPPDPGNQLEASADTVRQALSPELVRLAARPPRPEVVPVDTSGNESHLLPQGFPGEEADLKPLTAEQRALRDRVRRVLGYYFTKPLNTRDHNPWEMMHAIIAYGTETEIRRGAPNGPAVNAVSYICSNGNCHGLSLLFIDRDRINARKGPYVQGHYAQLAAILAQSRVPVSQTLRVGERSFTLGDLLETEKWTCDDNMELTFKLIAFSHYFDTDVTWTNFRGQKWSLPRIIKAELAAPILSNAACGGTHRLTGFAYAVRNRTRQGKPIEGEWLRAQKYLDDYHRYTLALQNSDGSFSTEWFRRREAKPDLDRRIQTTGHILEWLVYSLPADQLDHPQVVKAVDYLTSLMTSGTARKWEIGPLGHALHALAIYDARRYRPFDAPKELAKNDTTAESPATAPVEDAAVEEKEPEVGEVTITDETPVAASESAPAGDDAEVIREARRRLFGRDSAPGEESTKAAPGPLLRWREEREAESARDREATALPPARRGNSLAQQPPQRSILGLRLPPKPEPIETPLAPLLESIGIGKQQPALKPITDPGFSEPSSVAEPLISELAPLASEPAPVEPPASSPSSGKKGPRSIASPAAEESGGEAEDGPSLFFPNS